MNLTLQEEKIARLALDPAAKVGEIASAANKLVCSWRNRKITVEMIKTSERIIFQDKIVYQDRIVYQDKIIYQDKIVDRVVLVETPVDRIVKVYPGVVKRIVFGILFIFSVLINICASLPVLKNPGPVYTLAELQEYREEWNKEGRTELVRKADEEIRRLTLEEQKNRTGSENSTVASPSSVPRAVLVKSVPGVKIDPNDWRTWPTVDGSADASPSPSPKKPEPPIAEMSYADIDAYFSKNPPTTGVHEPDAVLIDSKKNKKH
jgi:hypothetical protein